VGAVGRVDWRCAKAEEATIASTARLTATIRLSLVAMVFYHAWRGRSGVI
jgi:hypothetical protein